MARGYLAAQRVFEENTGMGYTPFKMKDKETKQVRVLQSEHEWVQLFIHADFKKGLKSTRCAAAISTENDVQVEDRSTCPLCMAEAPRSPKTYIPVRVRGDENPARVQVIVYGRDHFQQVVNQIENLPEGSHMTDFDFKIVRKGDDLNTTYFWNIVADPKFNRPLDEKEAALEVPDMEETIVILEEGVLINRAQAFTDAANVTAVPAGNGAGNGSAKTPF